MIDYEPIKILFRIGPIEIRSYGFALLMAFTIGFLLAKSEAKRKGLEVDHIKKITLFMVLGSIIGARLVHVIEHVDFYSVYPLDIMKSWKGGASSYGGFIGGFLFMIVYTRKQKISIWKYADVFIPSLCMGIFITRIGCFLNWDDYGIASNLPWAINAGDFPRHPTQLYLAMNGLIFFVIFFRLRIKEKYDGELFLLFVIYYNSARLLIEFLRQENRYFLNLTTAQLFSSTLILIAIIYLTIRKRKIKSLFPVKE